MSERGVERLDALVRLLARHVLSHAAPEFCTADCMARVILDAEEQVPDGWFVVNPRHMAELKAARRAAERASDLADMWRDEPICGTTGAHEEALREALGDDLS